MKRPICILIAGIVFLSYFGCVEEDNPADSGKDSGDVDTTAPVIEDVLPENNGVSDTAIVGITGFINDESGIVNSASVTLGDSSVVIYPDSQDGSFSLEIELMYDTNEITITAEDTSNNVSEYSFNIIYTQADSSSEIVSDGSYAVVTTRSIVETGETEAGAASLISLDDLSANRDLLQSINSDNQVRAYPEGVFILEREDDNIIYSNDADMSPGSISQESFGSGVNIQDIVPISATMSCVVCLNSEYLYFYDYTAGVKRDSVDLSGYSHEGEVIPYLADVEYSNGTAYVMIQRLVMVQTEYGASPGTGDSTSLVVGVDTEARSVVSEVSLNYKNSYKMSLKDGFLYIGSPGEWDSNDGGIERIDVSTFESSEIILEESDIEGDVSNFAVASQSKGYVALAGYDSEGSFYTHLYPADLSAGTIGERITEVKYAFGGLAYTSGKLFAGDRSESASGVYVIDVDTDSVITGPVDVGFAPNDISVY